MNKQAIHALLAWYEKEKRDLPFRRQRDPYKIWISEIMAQQTRIEAMLGYYERFVARYPALPDLAEADEDELMKLWQGLGYYSRARNLKKAAVLCMEEYGGALPKTRDALKKLPGIGDYTAGAIASIAYGERVCALDGNVIRVGARYFWLDLNYSKTKEKKKLEALLQKSLPDEKDMPAFTQALMELGARVCLPQQANCHICPLAPWCKASSQPQPAFLPKRVVKAPRKIETKTAVVRAARKEGQWYLAVHKRPEKGLLAGLYEFDWQRPEKSASEIQPYALGEYRHVFSHVEWHMQGILCIEAYTEDMLPLLEIQEKAAIPSALQPFFKKACQILETIESPDGCKSMLSALKQQETGRQEAESDRSLPEGQ